MTKYLHIDRNVNILTDDEARRALETDNDVAFTDERGIAAVPKSRWETAQAAEQTHWMKRGLGVIDDRNYEHFSAFEGYRGLQGQRFEHAVELGCGPFTNMRIIADVCTVDECDLLDPLIDQYLTHPHCTYTVNRLSVDNTRIPSWLRSVSRSGFRLLGGKSVQVGSLLAGPIETMPLDRVYDMVVIVNVIEHCYDIDLVFENIKAITRPGSMIVFHDKYYDASRVREFTKTCYDAAHTLRVDRAIIDRFLGLFEPVYCEVRTTHDAVEGKALDNDYVYFIGRRL